MASEGERVDGSPLLCGAIEVMQAIVLESIRPGSGQCLEWIGLRNEQTIANWAACKRNAVYTRFMDVIPPPTNFHLEASGYECFRQMQLEHDSRMRR